MPPGRPAEGGGLERLRGASAPDHLSRSESFEDVAILRMLQDALIEGHGGLGLAAGSVFRKDAGEPRICRLRHTDKRNDLVYRVLNRYA